MGTKTTYMENPHANYAFLCLVLLHNLSYLINESPVTLTARNKPIVSTLNRFFAKKMVAFSKKCSIIDL